MLIGMSNQIVNQAVWPGVKASPHRFNRFEIKYLIPEQDVPALREQLATRMSTDPLSPPGGYRVESFTSIQPIYGATPKRSRV